MKKAFWEKEWLGISFCDLNINISFFKRPSPDFYSAFYIKVFQKYKSFEDLPINWREQKNRVAKEISLYLNEKNSILSYGCGLGYIEKILARTKKYNTFDAFDFSKASDGWLKDIEGINHISTLAKNKKYDFIYASQLLYSMNDHEIKVFSSFLFNTLSSNGKFLTINHSIKENENNENFQSNINLRKKIKSFLLPIYAPIYYILFSKKRYQFWGWGRDNLELSKILEANGLELIKSYPAVNESFLLFKLKNK